MVKGVGTTASVLITSVILLTIYGIYLQAANNQLDSNIKINLEELQLLKLKSTFYTFNQSLGTTWLISTVQAVFAAGDEGLGCGFGTDKRFWLQDKGDRKRNFTRADVAGMTDKYNGFSTPSVCYPKDADIIAYIGDSLATGGYLNLPSDIKPGDVEIKTGIPSYQINIDDDGVQSKFTQKITASYGKGAISTTTENTNAVKTKLRQMAAAGRQAVENLLALGDVYSNPDNEYAFFRPTNTPGQTASAAAYINSLAARVKTGIQQSGTDVKTDVVIQNAGIYVDDGAKLQQPWSGLILGYKATVRYSEVPAGATTATYDIPTDSKDITSCFGYRNDPITNEPGRFHGGIDIAPQTAGVSDPVYAIESGTVVEAYNGCQEGVQSCGAPSFSGYGNIVVIQHAGFFSLYAHLASAGVEIGQQVSQGEQIGMMGNTGRSTGMHLHFEIRQNDEQQDPCNYVKCGDSTGAVCTPITSSSRYYYYDKDLNTFSKRPVTMEFEVQDSLPALSCQWWSKYALDNFGNDAPIFFNYGKTADVMCCGGEIFSCGTDVDKMPGDQKLQPGESTQGAATTPQGRCNLILGGDRIACLNSGFDTTPR